MSNSLTIKSIRCFSGQVQHGIQIHPSNQFLIYVMGSRLILENINSKKQEFFTGLSHTNRITALSISPSGKLLATGQKTEIGLETMVIVWCFQTRKSIFSYQIHKTSVESLGFIDDDYLVSLGSCRDCGLLIVWNLISNHLQHRQKACKDNGMGSNASVICSLGNKTSVFLTVGYYCFKMWRIDVTKKQLQTYDMPVDKTKRQITAITVNDDATFAYCGTRKGDVIKIKLNFTDDNFKAFLIGIYTRLSKNTRFYELGVSDILKINDKQMIIGSGNGNIELVEESETKCVLKVIRKCNIGEKNAITSLVRVHEKSPYVIVGSTECEIYELSIETFTAKVMITCHKHTINEISFPIGCDDVFATASSQNIRIWRTETMNELLRINVANFTCTCLDFVPNGKSLISGWNDGVIRAFTPLTGRLQYEIPNSHHKGVSALRVSFSAEILLSGGFEGQMRIWDLTKSAPTLLAVLKEHTAPLIAITINQAGTEAVSAGEDGHCYIWDLLTNSRKHDLKLSQGKVLSMDSLKPDGEQILTTGLNHKITYWETYDGSVVREIELPTLLTCLKIDSTAKFFVTGGNDCSVKLWTYLDGCCVKNGLVHSTRVTSVSISPNLKCIVSGDENGCLIVWNV